MTLDDLLTEQARLACEDKLTAAQLLRCGELHRLILRETWDARVRGPGKYEGEPGWVALAWEEIVLGGCADEDVEIEGVIVSICTLDEEVRAAWPDAPERVALYAREDGFIMRADYDLVMRGGSRLLVGWTRKRGGSSPPGEAPNRPYSSCSRKEPTWTR